MTDFHILVVGRLVDGAQKMDVINRADGEVFAREPRASVADADAAVTEAKAANPVWHFLGGLPNARLGKIMHRIQRKNARERCD